MDLTNLTDMDIRERLVESLGAYCPIEVKAAVAAVPKYKDGVLAVECTSKTGYVFEWVPKGMYILEVKVAAYAQTLRDADLLPFRGMPAVDLSAGAVSVFLPHLGLSPNGYATLFPETGTIVYGFADIHDKTMSWESSRAISGQEIELLLEKAVTSGRAIKFCSPAFT